MLSLLFITYRNETEKERKLRLTNNKRLEEAEGIEKLIKESKEK